MKIWPASSVRVQLLLQGYARHLERGTRVLDVGCGNGHISKVVQDRFGVTMECADVEKMLEHDLPFHLVNGRIDLPSDAFDVAMLNDMLHHVPKSEQLALVLEAARVAPRVLIFDHEPSLVAKVLDVVMNYAVYGGREATPLAHRDARELCTLVSAAGLDCTIQAVRPPLYFPFRHFILVVGRRTTTGKSGERTASC